jgi:hypothetical protein
MEDHAAVIAEWQRHGAAGPPGWPSSRLSRKRNTPSPIVARGGAKPVSPRTGRSLRLTCSSRDWRND